MVARPLTALAGGKKKENVIVRGVCKIANFTGGRSVLSNYHQICTPRSKFKQSTEVKDVRVRAGKSSVVQDQRFEGQYNFNLLPPNLDILPPKTQ